MYSIDTISNWEFGMACIFCIVYVGSKLWIYYDTTKDTKGTIKRGPEWPE